MLVSTKTVRIVKENTDDDVSIEFEETTNLLELLNANDIGISQSCGGYGICTTCRVFVKDGAENLSDRTELEIERAHERSFTAEERLCCQTEVSGSVTVVIPEDSSHQ